LEIDDKTKLPIWVVYRTNCCTHNCSLIADNFKILLFYFTPQQGALRTVKTVKKELIDLRKAWIYEYKPGKR